MAPVHHLRGRGRAGEAFLTIISCSVGTPKPALKQPLLQAGLVKIAAP